MKLTRICVDKSHNFSPSLGFTLSAKREKNWRIYSQGFIYLHIGPHYFLFLFLSLNSSFYLITPQHLTFYSIMSIYNTWNFFYLIYSIFYFVQIIIYRVFTFSSSKMKFYPRNLNLIPESRNNSRCFCFIWDSLSQVTSLIWEFLHNILIIGIFLFLNSFTL